MLNNEFRKQYTTIPFAITSRVHKAYTVASNFGPLAHNHKEFEVLYVLDGEALCCIDTIEYKIKKGDMVVIAPYLIHRVTILATSDFSHNCVCFEMQMLYDSALREDLETGRVTPRPVLRHTEPYTDLLGQYIVTAHAAAERKAPGWEFQVIGNLSLFFSVLKENNLLQKHSDALTQSSFCHKVLSFIDDNYAKPITSTQMAELLFLNNSYFCRKFKENFGCQFQKYVEMYRIEKTKPLLKSTDIPISDIATAVGFGSFSYFSKVFKLYMQCTPSDYRKHHRQIQ